ncbi:MAG: serine/threonine-protein kinase [Myxococcota bacterium]|jgi:serine/threonine-protein kinase|nr:serine/threonine-protein kinase [Myxococcota bacterium]
MKQCPLCKQQFADELGFCPDDGTPLTGGRPPKIQDPLVGKVLAGRFELLACIGKGAFGAVYRARQRFVQGHRDVALKVIRAEHVGTPEVVARFLREAQTASSLSHPNIVTLFDFGQADDGTLFLAMELLEGSSLAAVLRAEGPFPLRRAVAVLRQVCDGLEPAHAQGIYHRDLKPENLMLSRVGSNPDFLKILDFGIARIDSAASPRLTRVGTTLGTPAYMAPEQGRGEEVDQRADIYALGVILFELLAGRPPFSGDSALAVMIQHCEAPVPALRSFVPTAELPPQVQTLVEQLLAKSREQRPASVQEVRLRLEDLVRSSRSATSTGPFYSGGGHEPARREAGSPRPAAYAGLEELPSPTPRVELLQDLVEAPTAPQQPLPLGLPGETGPVYELVRRRPPASRAPIFLVGVLSLLLLVGGLLLTRDHWLPLLPSSVRLAPELVPVAAPGRATPEAAPVPARPESLAGGQEVGRPAAPVPPAGASTDQPDRAAGGGVGAGPAATLTSAGPRPSPVLPAEAPRPGPPSGRATSGTGARRAPPAASGSAAAAASPAPRPSPPVRSSLRLLSSPPGAAIWEGDRRLGKTPLTLPVSLSTRSLWVRKEGYVATPLTIEGGAQGVRTVVMEEEDLPAWKDSP